MHIVGGEAFVAHMLLINESVNSRYTSGRGCAECQVHRVYRNADERAKA